jgi:hypothetical protein
VKTIKKEQLVEMARVSKYDIYDVYVHTDDSGKIPHFRIWDDNTRGQKFHTCIRLDKLAYFHHTGKEDKLNNKEIKKLVQFLEASPADKLFDSYWQLLVHMWNINNSDIIVDTNIKMPDYSLLNK